eukprot:CAMPEP_0117655524 /NCGR_PEP_ID=MMETSP0804-20121206/4323_1 /TAXON_ID=1074897 /ORGANISM="Tetraselmis astigmatica, Strain CCMP880" /LENGTH=45 /DNA_ID= /DNA_START= /DNA_END= /DNA_ORIENTATION=
MVADALWNSSSVVLDLPTGVSPRRQRGTQLPGWMRSMLGGRPLEK